MWICKTFRSTDGHNRTGTQQAKMIVYTTFTTILSTYILLRHNQMVVRETASQHFTYSFALFARRVGHIIWRDVSNIMLARPPQWRAMCPCQNRQRSVRKIGMDLHYCSHFVTGFVFLQFYQRNAHNCNDNVFIVSQYALWITQSCWFSRPYNNELQIS